MKLKVLAIAAGLLAASCTTHFGNRKLADGWYRVTDTQNNIVENRPIAKADDFQDLKLDSMRIDGSYQTIYTITGKCGDTQKFADATENAIGNHIAFLFDGKMVCAQRRHAGTGTHPGSGPEPAGGSPDPSARRHDPAQSLAQSRDHFPQKVTAARRRGDKEPPYG